MICSVEINLDQRRDKVAFSRGGAGRSTLR